MDFGENEQQSPGVLLFHAVIAVAYIISSEIFFAILLGILAAVNLDTVFFRMSYLGYSIMWIIIARSLTSSKAGGTATSFMIAAMYVILISSAQGAVLVPVVVTFSLAFGSHYSSNTCFRHRKTSGFRKLFSEFFKYSETSYCSITTLLNEKSSTGLYDTREPYLASRSCLQLFYWLILLVLLINPSNSDFLSLAARSRHLGTKKH
ncbi:MAG: hypothetical protein ACFFD4_14305 [Candidatus Odinarchaeota archaeon]